MQKLENVVIMSLEEYNKLVSERPIKNDLQVGKWYWGEYKDMLICINQKDINEVKGYGFFYEKWRSDLFSCDDALTTLKKPTKQEVEEVLIKEARRRGLIEGAKLNNSNIHGFNVDDNLIEDFNCYEFNIEKNELYITYKEDEYTLFPILKNGKWAEVVEEDKPKVGDVVKVWDNNDNTFSIGKVIEIDSIASRYYLQDNLWWDNAETLTPEQVTELLFNQ